MRMLVAFSTLVSVAASLGGVAAAKTPSARHVFALRAQNGSTEAGTVALEARGASTDVSIHVSGAPKGVVQPAHVHPGTCANPAPVPKFVLQPVVGGMSDKVIPVSVAGLTARPYVVEVHKSLKEMNVYVACAALTR